MDKNTSHSTAIFFPKGTIRDNVPIGPYVVVTNDRHPPSECRIGAKIHDYASIATMSVILPGVIIGEGVLIGAHSLVNKDIPPHKLALGSPAKVICDTSKIELKDGSGRSAYPWQYHFHRGYPDDIVRVWMERAGVLEGK